MEGLKPTSFEGLKPPSFQENIFHTRDDDQQAAARLNLVYAARAEQRLKEVQKQAAEAVEEAEQGKLEALRIASEANAHARQAHLAREREAGIQVWSLGANSSEDESQVVANNGPVFNGGCPYAFYESLHGNARRKRSSRSLGPLVTC